MTDLPEKLTTGERIRILRERRGLSRPVLAGLVGKSSEWLKKIENGDRPLTSITHLVRLATVLRVNDLATLTGGDLSVPVNAVGKLSHPSVSAIRDAMHGVSFRGTPTVGTVTPRALNGRIEGAWRLRHNTHTLVSVRCVQRRDPRRERRRGTADTRGGAEAR